MKAILLCAGYGTRLHPLTQDKPKPLLSVGERPILSHLLDIVKEIPSVDQVFLVSNARFYPHFKEWASTQRYPWKIEVVNDGTETNETRLGAIGDLRFVLEKFHLHDDLGIFAGDNLFLCELKSFFSFALTHRPYPSLGVVDIQNRDLAKQYGVVEIDQEGRIVRFFEKPPDPPSTLVSTGVYWFAKEGLDLLDRYVQEGHNADRLGDYIGWLVKRARVFAHPLKGKWFDIGDLDSYQEANRLFGGKKIQRRETSL